ncbi:MAG TPA: efflux RND transporter periplasmic adaptor subunit [Caulobacteraceae bacterium]
MPVRKPFALISASLAAGLLLAGCAPKPAAAPPPPSVTVSRPLQETVIDWDDYVGQFVAEDSVDVRPRVSGYLQSVGFKDGDVVRKGQVLFVIDPRPYRAALDQAKGQQAHAAAALANATTEAARGAQLLAAKAISQEAYDLLIATERQDAADLLAAQANVRTNALNLEFTRVVAPLGGRVSDRRIAPGNLVTADVTVLTNIVNLDPIRFAFTGSEAAYLKYQRENAAGTRPSSRVAPTPVEIRLQDEATYRWKGRMDFVDNALDTGSGTIRGRAVVDNPGNFLTPGMFGHMRLQGSGAYLALLIPDQAIVTDQTRQVVYVVAANGKVSERDVTPGPLTGGLRVIRQGIGPNDLIIIDGVQRARVGQKVTPHQGRITPAPAASDDQAANAVGEPAGSATIVDAGPAATPAR